MKHGSFFLAGFILIVLCVACEKKVEQSKSTVHETAARIYTSANFIKFTKSFLVDFKSASDYYRVPAVQTNINGFTALLRGAGDDDEKLSNAFTAYSLSYEEAIARRNKVDNDLLQLFNSERVLLQYNEPDTWQIIKEAIDMGMRSQLDAWQEVRSYHTIGNLTPVTNAIGGVVPHVNVLTGDEVWDCVKTAVGAGSASILGIAALQKLASEGIQVAVVTLSKWLAQRAGWIGAAIMLFDFSSCMYTQYRD